MIFFLRIAALLALLWFVYRVLKSIFKGAMSLMGGAASEPSRQIADMVRDPECGSYISVDHSVKAEINGETVHFCSDGCLEKYRNKSHG